MVEKDMQASAMCLTMTGIALLDPGWAAFTFGFNGKLSMCSDLGLSQEYCSASGSIDIQACGTKGFNDALLKALGNPKGFLSRREPNTWKAFDAFYNNPNSMALGTHPGTASSIGGIMVPKLKRETFRDLISNGGWSLGHLAHGAPLKVRSNSNGYPHRKEGYLVTSSPSIEWTNILLNDPAYGGDPMNLRVYGNYGPSTQMLYFEKHVFGEKAEKLSKIRNCYDPLGGFDSPRYVQRNRQTSSSGLSAGVIAGTVVGALAVVGILIAAAYWCVYKRGTDSKQERSETAKDEQHLDSLRSTGSSKSATSSNQSSVGLWTSRRPSTISATGASEELKKIEEEKDEEKYGYSDDFQLTSNFEESMEISWGGGVHSETRKETIEKMKKKKKPKKDKKKKTKTKPSKREQPRTLHSLYPTAGHK